MGGDGHLDENDAIDLVVAAAELPAEAHAAARRHLDGCEPCRALVAAVAKLVVEAPADRGAGSVPDGEPIGWGALRLAPGERVGAFVVVEALGEGAMGAVYRARDPRLGRDVALKLLGADLDDDEALRRLRAEARSMAQLAHPNVIEVLDVGGSVYGPFVAMAFVDGRDLRGWLTAEPRALPDIVHTLVLAGRGLAAAHAAGIVHRDFKPTNVLVGHDGAVRVADFGLAIVRRAPAGWARSAPLELAGEVSAVRTMTASGAQIAGTPAYMAPEQVRGEPPTELADQFAFCVTLFEALTGHRPFEEGSMALRQASIEAHRWRPPARRIPGHVEAVLRRGLAADPSARFASMAALLARLQAPHGRRARRAGVVVATLIGGAVVGGWALQGRQTTGPTACAALPAALPWGGSRRDALRQAWEAIGADTFSIGRVLRGLDRYAAQWSALHDDTCGPDRDDAAAAQTAACLVRLVAEFDAFAADATVASLQHTHGFAAATRRLVPVRRCVDGRVSGAPDRGLDTKLSRLRGRYLAAMAMSDLETLRALASPVGAVVEEAAARGNAAVEAETSQMLGVLYADVGQWARAESWLERAFFVADASGRPHLASDAARARSVLALMDPSRVDDARQWARHARSALDVEADPVGRVQLLVHEADLALTVDDDDAAQQALQEATEWLRPDFPAHVHISLHTTRGRLRGRADDLPGSRDAFATAVAVGAARLGPDHPDLLRPLNGLAVSQMRLGHHREASQTLLRVVALGDKRGDLTGTAAASGNLGLLFRMTGQPTKALHQLRRADALFAKIYPEGHRERQRSTANLAEGCMDVGRLDEAVALAAQAERSEFADGDSGVEPRYHARLTGASSRAMRGDAGVVSELRRLVREATSETYGIEATISLMQALRGEGDADEIVRLGAGVYAPAPAAKRPSMSMLRYAEGRLFYAEALATVGRSEQAREQIARALALAEAYEADDPRDVTGRIRRSAAR